MTVPSDAVLDTILEEIEGLGFATGTAAQNLAALSIAWELAEYGVGTNLLASGTAGDQCEEHYWPTGWVDYDERYRMVVLKKTRLRSVNSVSVVHEEYDCNCTTTEDEGCVTRYNDERSEIALGDCFGFLCGGCSAMGTNRFKAEICYTAGLFTTLAEIPFTVISALGFLYSWWLEMLATGGSAAAANTITSWRSMDYNEAYAAIEKSILGSSPQAAAAWVLLRKHRIVRAVVIRSHFPAQYRRW